MRKNYFIFGGIVGLIIINAYINSAVIWAICLLSVLLYSELRAREIKENIDNVESAGGKRLIQGLKALTELCSNAFDHIKDHKSKIDKINSIANQLSVKMQRTQDKQKHQGQIQKKQKTGVSFVEYHNMMKKEDKRKDDNDNKNS